MGAMDMRIPINLILTLFFVFFAEAKTYYFFEPPKNWECIDPKALSPSVEVGFLGKGKAQYFPTINLASEEVDSTLSQYVKDVKKIHKLDKNTSFRDLGKLKTKAGPAQLLELTTKTKFGVVKMFQAILVKNKKAIVLTAAMQKDEFIDMHKIFIQAFRSLTFTNNLTDPIQDPKKQQTLKLAISDLENLTDPIQAQKKLKTIQKMVQNNYQELGLHWQLLLLNEAQAKLANKMKKNERTAK